MGTLSLILGGARSGKSRVAEQRVGELVGGSGKPAIYVATASAGDDEMQARIKHHRNDRERQAISWQTVEEPLRLAAVIRGQTEQSAILVDCLTLWLSNCLHRDCWPSERAEFIAALRAHIQNEHAGELLLVSNETGLGVVPMGQLSREFVDESGFLHQEVASLAQRVTLVVAGLPTELKPK